MKKQHETVGQMEQRGQWFAVRTKPCKEFVAQVHYEQQGFTTYLPRIKKTRKHARKVEQVARPFFPGYLFLWLAPEERDWAAIGSTRGAIGPVRFGKLIPPVPEWVITTLRSMEDRNSYIKPRALVERYLQPGVEVQVALDDQRQMRGLFLSYRGEDRAVVLLELLRRKTEITVPVESLRKIA